MRILLPFIALLIFSFGNAESLDGCKTPEAFSKFLLEVKELNWSSITVREVEKKWPELVLNHDCGSEGCSFAIDIQRLIDPDCECCAVLVFRKEEEKEILKGLNFYYASETRHGALKFLKQVIPVTGVEADYNPEKTLTQQQRNEQTWRKEISGKQINVEMEMYSKKGLWFVELGYSQKTNIGSP